MSSKKCTYPSALLVFFFYSLSVTSKSQAQVISDGTLSTEVTTSDELNFNITGSSQEGKNLFHSFREFSVPTGGSAIFANDMDVENIISRVTGGSISHINGLIQTQGSANLFLLNPKGIIFGRNAQLDIGGSFIASTANQINFADGTIFSATDLESQPLLTVNIPVGLQFREKPGNIINQSIVNEGLGLNVQSGKTLALVGSDVFLKGGVLTAIGGRIELGSVAAPAFVSLNPITAGWVLGYSSVQNFQDIQLSQGAVVQTIAEGIGDIQLQGRRIAITSKSQVVRFNYGADPGGVITIKASESVQVSGDSNLTTTAFLTGAAADIIIETRRLFVRDNGSFIETTTRGDGRGGNLIVNATESVEVDGGGQGNSALRTQTLASGNAGDLKIRTDRLILSNGGLLASSTNGVGDGGAISIEDSELIEVSGQGVLDDEVSPSGLFARTSGDEATGNGGTISINTERLVIKDRGAISVAAAEGSIGQAGTLEINASELVVVSGTGSTLLTESESTKPAGNLTISTGELIIQNGGEVSASSIGEGGAGNLQINAPSIRLNQQGVLRAETRAGEGNITLQAQDIILRDNSKITTNATGEASGGNITINTGVLAALENSDITANAVEAEGGRVSITAQGIFGTEFRSEQTSESDITADSALGPEFSGTVELNTPEVDPSRGLVELPETVVDPNALIAQNPCKKGAQSEFTVTRRGGLPPSLNEDLISEAVQVGLVEPVSPPETEAQSQRASLDTSSIQNPKPPGRTESEQRKTQNPIMPAQGWVFNDDKGEVVLTAYTPTVTGSQRQPTNSAICPAPSKK